MATSRRVLMVTQPSDGGVFEHVCRLSRGLTGRGLEVVVCGPVAGLEESLGTEVAELALTRAVSPRADFRAAAELARIVREFRPHVIHAHSSKAGAVARIARLAAPRTPLVYTPHGYAFAGYFERESERRAYRQFERVLARLATRTLCVCEAEGRLAASIGPARRVRVVHNGIEAPPSGAAPPALAGLRREGPVIGALALLRPGKGLETLIDAMSEVVARHPAASLVVAGEGAGRQELERRARERGVGDRVRLIGQTRGPGPLLRGCDVYCSPSWAESFPYSLIEAMWLDLPIVSTDVGGCSEAIEDAHSGSLVPPRDPGALAGAILRLLDDPELARGLGARAGERARELFTADRMVEGTLAVFGEVGV